MSVNKSSIEWTESTWNPVTGCNKVSPGCKHCYAERLAKRLQRIGLERYKNAFNLTLHEDSIDIPLGWKSPRTIFVNSMSDLFHEKIPFQFIEKIFDTMKAAYWHQFQILTKRSEILKEYAYKLEWTNNIWMGVSVESQKYTYRIDDLKKVPAAVRFLSIEPLLGNIEKMNLNGIDWVIVGGESGPKSRPIKLEWVLNIKSICESNSVPFSLNSGEVQGKKRPVEFFKGKLGMKCLFLKIHG